ncbi:MAG: hypothetical protein M0P09_08030 [Acholeplasmataceae bacterium]|nr:hypothetical protein [Acholeplasmataceae bacterium]
MAEETDFSRLFYSDKAKMWGANYKSFGLEFYSKGFYSMFGPDSEHTMNHGYVDNFDWRNRHGANNETSPYYDNDPNGTGWITPVVCQGLGCWYNNEFLCNVGPAECAALGGIYREAATCWAFGPTAQVEALINLYYNEHIDIDLSEQYIVCEENTIGAWIPERAYNHYLEEGVPDEDCLPYSASLENCDDLCDNPTERVWIDNYEYHGRDHNSHVDVRNYLMEYGPVNASAMEHPWGPQSHSMLLVGWGVIDEDALHITGINNEPIHTDWYGVTYWIYKQSEGPGKFNNGFQYIIHWKDKHPNIYTIDPKVTTLNRTESDINCYDKDGDGYYFWGIGPKPDHCPPCPDEPDGDDSNPSLGPINEYGVCSIINTYTASFENGWDNWVQTNEDDGDWWRHQGPTPTDNTGPDAAQDGDFYIYTETDPWFYPDYKFIIESPPIKLDKYCEGQIEFYYHMHTPLWGNPNTTKLELQFSYDDGLNWSPSNWSVMDDQGNEWHLGKVAFPTNVNKMRFIATTGKSVQSNIALDNITIGPYIKEEVPLSITSDTIWSGNPIFGNNIVINSDLVIETGVELLILNCTIKLHEESKIIIKPGGRLILDNTLLRSKCLAHPWQGIEVWGNRNASQHALPGQPNPQGKLILKNGAVIENAHNAVTLWKPGDFNTTGGIIIANDAVFRNNRRSVEFMSYQNFHPLDTLAYDGNVSYFTNCTFEVDENYQINSPFHAHVTLWDVSGVQFKGNTFQSSLEDTPGKGIYSINANYKLIPWCSDQMIPCQNLVLNRFIGFDAAIEALVSVTGPLRTIFVDSAQFINSGYGIKLNNLNNASITNSVFEIGKFTNHTCTTDFGIGIELSECNGYLVEGNHFSLAADNSGEGSIGIRVFNEDYPSVVNEIYRNSFNGLNRGNLAEGKNILATNSFRGLVYQCNQNTDNYCDFHITGQGIAGHQGSLNIPAGNTFSFMSGVFMSPRHIANYSTNHIDYYYSSARDQEPLYFINTTKRLIVNFNSCPSSFGGGSGQTDLLGLSPDQQIYFAEQSASSRAALNSLSALYASLVDGGSTTSMLTAVETALPGDMWDLRAQLLGGAPHLSKEVLKKAADRTDVLPESIIFELLSTNPDELKDAELIEFLQTKSNPLPEEMIEVLIGLRDNITYKTILQSQMGKYGLQQFRADRALLHDLVHNHGSDIEGIRNLLAAAQSLPMDMQLVELFMQERKTEQALSLAAMLPQLYSLTGEELEEYNRFVSLKQLQADIWSEGRSIFDLEPSEKSLLFNLMDESQGLAGTQARNILAFIGDYEYCDCPAIFDDELKTQAISDKNVQTLLAPSLDVRPNPANSWVSFGYTLSDEKSQAVLEIYDAAGKTIHQAQLSQSKG